MLEKKNNILKSFIDFFYGNFIVLLLGFVSLPLITRVLPTDEYGRTAMFQSVVSVIYIFAILGLDQGYIRYYYKEGISRKKLFVQCLFPPVVLIAILSILYVLGSKTFNNILFERHSLDITLLVVAYVVTSVFERFVFLNIRMDQKGKLYSNLNILSKVLYISFIVIFAYIIGSDFRVVLYGLTLPLMIVTVGLLIRYLIINKKEKINIFDLNNNDVTEKELLKYSVPFIPMLLMEWLLSSMDRWSIRFFNDFSETGVYSAAMQIMTIILTVKITFVAFWSPIAMEKYENESEETCKEFFSDMFLKVQFLCMSMAFGLVIFRGIIVLILGASYREAISVIPFLTLMPVLSILFEMTGQGIKFVKKVKYLNYASFAAIICNLVGNALLVPRFRGVGAALATGITYIVYFLIGTYYANKCYKVNYKLGRFMVSMLLYMAYASYATITNNEMYSVVLGIILLTINCLINIDVIKSLIKVAVGILKK